MLAQRVLRIINGKQWENNWYTKKESTRKGPLRWEWSYRLFAVIEKSPNITAEQLQAEGACIGIEISLRTAFRFPAPLP